MAGVHGDRAVLDHRRSVRRRGARRVLRGLHRAGRSRSWRLAGERAVVCRRRGRGRRRRRAPCRPRARGVLVTDARPRERPAVRRRRSEPRGSRSGRAGTIRSDLEGATLVVTGPGVRPGCRGPLDGLASVVCRVVGRDGARRAHGRVRRTSRSRERTARRPSRRWSKPVCEPAGYDALACGNIGLSFPEAAREEHDALVVEASWLPARVRRSRSSRASRCC